MGFKLDDSQSEERAILRHGDSIDDELKAAHLSPRRAVELINERDRIDDLLRRAQIHDLDAQLKSLQGKTDLDSVDRRVSLETHRLDIEDRIAVSLDEHAAVAAKRKQLQPEVDQAMARAAAQRERTAEAARRKDAEDAVANAPWVRSLVAKSPIAPNGCPTCANSATRALAASVAKEAETLTPGMARLNVARLYPGIPLRPTPQVQLVEGGAMEETCGKHSVACARPTEGTIFITDKARADIVQHEVNHGLTSDKWMMIAPATVNEGVTEYFTRRLGYFAPDGGVRTKAYEGAQHLIDDYVNEKPGRELALAKAYFGGDFSDLEMLETKSARVDFRDFEPPPGNATNGLPLESKVADFVNESNRRSGVSAMFDRFAQWNELLENKLPGSDVTNDDEAIREEAKSAADAGNWGLDR